MKQYQKELKEYLEKSGTSSFLKEDSFDYPAYTADLTDLPNRTEFLKGLVDLVHVPYDLSKPYYSRIAGTLAGYPLIAKEDLPKLFPSTAYVEVSFRHVSAKLSFYETRYNSTQGLLGTYHTGFFDSNMDFKPGDFIDVTSVHPDSNVGVFLVSREFNLQELTDDFARSVSEPTKNIGVRELLLFGLRNGYWTKPVRKINMNVNSTNNELVVRTMDGIDNARVIVEY